MKTLLILLALSLTGCATAVSISPFSSCYYVKYERENGHVEIIAKCDV